MIGRLIALTIGLVAGFVLASALAELSRLWPTTIRRRLDGGEDAADAIFNGTLQRLRPVLMTALVASLGFVPMAVATGPGAEV